ncbi:MAG: SEC-C domain-containing protein [Planctomycetes bacterium]|nr:SEC-C domain-containing protein [Planctomycetota bacterium]
MIPLFSRIRLSACRKGGKSGSCNLSALPWLDGQISKGGALQPQEFETFKKCRAFETTSKRRRGYPSESSVKPGDRSVTTPLGEKEFLEKLGRNDPCPCGSMLRFQEVLHANRPIRRLASQVSYER